jgi:hypothetical protein
MASILAAEESATTVSLTALTDRIDINRAILPGWNSIFFLMPKLIVAIHIIGPILVDWQA